MHYIVGREVRFAIERVGGVMPENLPASDKNILEVEQKTVKQTEKNVKNTYA